MNTTAEAGKTNLTMPGDREIHVERIFNAPRETVWQAYTDPKLVAQWWGRGNKLDVEKMELVKDGRWRFVEHSGEKPFGFEGRYIEVTPPERIVQTFGWDGMEGHEIIETAEFHDLGDGRTKLVATSVFQNAEERTAMLGYGMETGMNESYAALDRLLETLT